MAAELLLSTINNKLIVTAQTREANPIQVTIKLKHLWFYILNLQIISQANPSPIQLGCDPFEIKSCLSINILGNLAGFSIYICRWGEGMFPPPPLGDGGYIEGGINLWKGGWEYIFSTKSPPPERLFWRNPSPPPQKKNGLLYFCCKHITSLINNICI